MSTLKTERAVPDEKSLRLVFGYVRHIENYTGQCLPDPIILLCVSFYFVLNEFFATRGASTEQYLIDESRKVVEVREGYGKECLYGNVAIASESGGIHCWTFKILHKETSMSFGITSDTKNERKFYQNEESSNYSLLYMGYKNSKGKSEDYDMDSFHDGDCLKMKLDLHTKELIYYHNDKCLGAAYTDIDTHSELEYRLAIYLMNQLTKIELVEYTVSN